MIWKSRWGYTYILPFWHCCFSSLSNGVGFRLRDDIIESPLVVDSRPLQKSTEDMWESRKPVWPDQFSSDDVALFWGILKRFKKKDASTIHFSRRWFQALSDQLMDTMTAARQWFGSQMSKNSTFYVSLSFTSLFSELLFQLCKAAKNIVRMCQTQKFLKTFQNRIWSINKSPGTHYNNPSIQAQKRFYVKC